MPACPHSGPLPVRGDSPAGTTCPDLARRDSLGRQDRAGTARPHLLDRNSLPFPIQCSSADHMVPDLFSTAAVRGDDRASATVYCGASASREDHGAWFRHPHFQAPVATREPATQHDHPPLIALKNGCCLHGYEVLDEGQDPSLHHDSWCPYPGSSDLTGPSLRSSETGTERRLQAAADTPGRPTRVYIYDECIAVCNAILEDDKSEKPPD
jgi:hypothetical protein